MHWEDPEGWGGEGGGRGYRDGEKKKLMGLFNTLAMYCALCEGKEQKQYKCLSKDEWIKKMWCIYWVDKIFVWVFPLHLVEKPK